jgi:hypothetical protein
LDANSLLYILYDGRPGRKGRGSSSAKDPVIHNLGEPVEHQLHHVAGLGKKEQCIPLLSHHFVSPATTLRKSISELTTTTITGVFLPFCTALNHFPLPLIFLLLCNPDPLPKSHTYIYMVSTRKQKLTLANWNLYSFLFVILLYIVTSKEETSEEKAVS